MCRFVVGLPDLCTQELGGTGGDASAEDGSSSDGCHHTACEGKFWPAVAVRFASDQIARADVQFILSDGRVFSGDSQMGCPMWPPQIPAELSCDTGFILGDQDTEIVIRVAPAGLVPAQATVQVAPKNYCAANIAYITVSVLDGAVEISAPEYRSPCVELGL
jgi:hypothetical protein